MEYPDQLLGHFLIATLGWLFGMVPGITLGYGLAIASRKIHLTGRWPRFVATLMPWRAMVAALALPNLMPLLGPLAVRYLGAPRDFARIGFNWEVADVALLVFLCAVPVTAGIVRTSRAPAPVALQAASCARTMGVLAVVVAAYVGFWTFDSGLGGLVALHYELLQFVAAISVIPWIIGVALVVDLVLGVLEFLVALRTAAGSAVPALRSTV